ncbi:MAG: hypothetical protein KGH61_00335 [Candidatus Micrarchaeota archaeon]|nr:hypothetical protein [Candidatus Micrarchaeota archaeon]MDE1847384.1 hypothetical protein [Candidatus Micrarchaeota archaeon]MDE1863999.1 hypothetical protein [Candidatus Micrarchaeota archaeon]
MAGQNKTLFVAILIVSTFLGAVGQLLFKVGVNSQATVLLLAFVIAGFMVYIISTVLYLYTLSRTHLSWAYGFGGLSYIFTSILAYFVLGEAIPALRWIGVLVIVAGVALIGLS